ncbi:MAG: C45 family autoproteolytic acyltransferase/hydrolase [Actinomycetota bacterium]|nr:C45 family autoproteolytic acyltransferase/hydrolase [Actinomycetota bacterium]
MRERFEDEPKVSLPASENLGSTPLANELPRPYPKPLHFYGKNHFEWGYEVGRWGRRFVKPLSSLLRRTAYLEEVLRERRKNLDLLKREAPSSFEEIRGEAKGLGLDIEDFFVIRMAFQNLFFHGCTTFGARPPATRDGEIMVSWNVDTFPLPKIGRARFPFFIHDVEGTIPYLSIGVPGLGGLGILNASGLTCVANAVGLTDRGEGVGPLELNNRAMETCSTVRETEKLYRGVPRQATKGFNVAIFFNFNTLWADKEGDIAVFEYSHNYFHCQRAEGEGIIAATNHHQFLDRSLTGSPDPTIQEDITGSYSRLGRIWYLLRENQGRIDPLTAKTIISDHVPDYSLLREFGIEREPWEEKIDDSTICAHPWNLKNHLKRGELGKFFIELAVSNTIYSIQIQPRSFTTWFSNGNPCQNPSVPFFWGRELGAQVEEGYPGALPAYAYYPVKKQRVKKGLLRTEEDGSEGAFAVKLRGAIETVEEKLV